MERRTACCSLEDGAKRLQFRGGRLGIRDTRDGTPLSKGRDGRRERVEGGKPSLVEGVEFFDVGRYVLFHNLIYFNN